MQHSQVRDNLSGFVYVMCVYVWCVRCVCVCLCVCVCVCVGDVCIVDNNLL